MNLFSPFFLLAPLLSEDGTREMWLISSNNQQDRQVLSLQSRRRFPLYRPKDLDNADGFFVFSDIAVKMDGRFAITLFEVGTAAAKNLLFSEPSVRCFVI
jgi:hypothetical protein